MSSIECGLIGCGTVGSGVVRLWTSPGHAPGARLGAVAVKDLTKRRAVDLASLRLTDDPIALVRDGGVSLVVEATGDTETGHTLALEALARRKPFVTASKGLVAAHGAELEARAAEMGVAFRYEAAAAGAIPVVALLRLGLSPGPVRAIEGVLNGTCNVVLTRLERGVPFAAAVAEAQRAGFAEADPARDLTGLDTLDKLVILARLCGVGLDPARVPVRGIDGVTPDDVRFGFRHGWALRLVASFRRDPEVTASVRPVFVPADSLLARAHHEENAVVLDAGAAGRLGLVGRGAGAEPSAAAILADVREVLRGAPAPPARTVEAATLAEDVQAWSHYVRVLDDGPPRRDTLRRALARAGIGANLLVSASPGVIQAVTAPAPTRAVERALEGLTGALAVPIHDIAELTVAARTAEGGAR